MHHRRNKLGVSERGRMEEARQEELGRLKRRRALLMFDLGMSRFMRLDAVRRIERPKG